MRHSAVSGCAVRPLGAETCAVHQGRRSRGRLPGWHLPARTPCTRDQMAVYVARGRGDPGGYDNLYDPEQIGISAVFVTPSARQVEVPGVLLPAVLSLRRDGLGAIDTGWGGRVQGQVRLAGGGDYTYEVAARSPYGERVIGTGEFTVTPADDPGYVRGSETAPVYFEFDSGAPYFAIGENMCWPQGGGTYDCDVWMANLAGHGGNYIRLWLVNEWNQLGLEHLRRRPAMAMGWGAMTSRRPGGWITSSTWVGS